MTRRPTTSGRPDAEQNVRESLATLLRFWVQRLESDVSQIGDYVSEFEKERRADQLGGIAVIVQDHAKRVSELAATLSWLAKETRP